jgi:hypothetical protein
VETDRAPKDLFLEPSSPTASQLLRAALNGETPGEIATLRTIPQAKAG